MENIVVTHVRKLLDIPEAGILKTFRKSDGEIFERLQKLHADGVAWDCVSHHQFHDCPHLEDMWVMKDPHGGLWVLINDLEARESVAYAAEPTAVKLLDLN